MTPSPELLGPVTVGAREIYDQGLRTQALVERLGDRIEDLSKDMVDHEARIRALERGRWPLPSVAALIALVSIVMTVWQAISVRR